MWQARHVRDLLLNHDPGLEIELVGVSTEGDRRIDVPLSEIGGKGVFATEVQAAVLDGRADLAVHSAKDLPAVTGAGLLLAGVPRRGDPRDALVGTPLEQIPDGGVIATGSARRRAQLAALRPDLRFAELRGNMATRLSRATEFDAIVVAAIAFERLEMAENLTEVLSEDVMVPQVGQAALALECRAEDERVAGLAAAIQDPRTRRCVDAERSFLAELGGDCSLPAGAHAVLGEDDSITITAILADDVGGNFRRGSVSGSDGDALGHELARTLRSELEQAGSQAPGT